MPDTSRLRWAIAGTGNIARRFAEDLRVSANGRAVAVASAVPDRAARFAAAIGPYAFHGDLDAVLARPDVDAVYIAGRNDLHCEHALRCLAADKPVLIEKPFATSVEEAERIVEAARSANRLAMEAMWMRFIPAMRTLADRVKRGDIGTPRTVEASLAFDNPQPLAPVLPDLGVYPVSLAVQLLGAPAAVAAAAAANGTQIALLLTYPQAIATLSCSFAAQGANTATVTGTAGILQTNAPLIAPTLLRFRRTGAIAQPRREGPLAARPRFTGREAMRALVGGWRGQHRPVLYAGNGLHYEADHFAECLRNGLTESPVMPLGESLAVMRVLAEAEAALAAQSAKTSGAKVVTGR